MRPSDVLFGSYPRSGSTWLRFVLFECLTAQPADYEIVDRTLPELGDHRGAPALLRESGRVIHTHERWRPPGPLALYMVRDPRSVLLSEYRFNQRRRLPVGTLPDFARNFIAGRTSPHGSWSQHVTYWMGQATPHAQVSVVRFEDLHAKPVETVGELLGAWAIPMPDDVIRRAVRHNDRDNMREKEVAARHNAFGAREDLTIPFVGKGSPDAWREDLSPKLAGEVKKAMWGAMRVAGYD